MNFFSLKVKVLKLQGFARTSCCDHFDIYIAVACCISDGDIECDRLVTTVGECEKTLKNSFLGRIFSALYLDLS